ncbi:L-lactate permease [Sphingorhabdus sp.]|uniref:L-lactate permease n=1 Tax=Sphingorhabdus sp. TaxID=1902408 RepID=UPI0035B125BC
MQALYALLPIVFLLFLLVGMRWSAASAGMASTAIAATVAIFGFDLGSSPPGLVKSLVGTFVEASFLALTILWIVFPALCILEYQTRNGSVALLGNWTGRLGKDRRVAALLIAWFFALFLEGAAGFGTSVALAAPLLVAAGFSPLRALTLALIGHAVGVSFGAIGTPMLPLLAPGLLDPNALSFMVALLHATLGWTMTAMVYWLAGSGLADRGSAVAASGWVALAAISFFVPATFLAWLIGPELPTLGGALFGGLVFVGYVRWRQRQSDQERAPVPAHRLYLAMLPYLIVLGLVLLTRLEPHLGAFLQDAAFEWSLFDNFGGKIAPLYHPGTILLFGFVLTGIVGPKRTTALPAAAMAAARRIPRVAFALVSVLLLARLMVHAGMIEKLALASASLLGPSWPLAAPAVGALGSFVTGSATASNILFGEFQYSTAAAVGLSPLLMTAAQAFGAAIGNIVAPHNIISGAATVGLVGREGEVLKRTLPACLLYTFAGGVLVFVLSNSWF